MRVAVLRDVSTSSVNKSSDRLEERRIVLQSTDFVVFMLTGLFAISVIGALWVAKPLLMPMAAALIIGTMLSAGAGPLERSRMPLSLPVPLMRTESLGII